MLCLQAESRLLDSCVVYSDFAVNLSFLKQVPSLKKGIHPSKCRENVNQYTIFALKLQVVLDTVFERGASLF